MNGSLGPIDVERPLDVIGGPKEEDVITNASSYEGGVISNS